MKRIRTSGRRSSTTRCRVWSISPAAPRTFMPARRVPPSQIVFCSRFTKIIDTAIRAVQRGGKKKGALCFYMENWHYDFPEFLDWKHNAGDDYLRMRTANTAVFLSDEFMRRLASGADWYLFDPKEVSDLNELYGERFAKRYQEYIGMAEDGK